MGEGTRRQPHIVVIGGGTGTFALLTGLKRHHCRITAIINMADDGGSTGVLRDELGVLPPGDVRQALVALSQSDQIMRDLFDYRFENGALHGHSFGNLFLTALEKTTGSFETAVRVASDILNISGRVIPVTLQDCQLVLINADGSTTVGQFAVRTARFDTHPPHLRLEPQAKLNPEAATAIAAADLVVIAPGNLYSSLAPALLVTGISQALTSTPAKLVYVSNLVNKPGQTDGFQVHDLAAEIERFIGRPALNYVIYNRRHPSPELLRKYAAAGEFAVEYDLDKLSRQHYQVRGADLVSDTIPVLKPAERLIPRTLIRHDSDKLADIILEIATQ